MHVCIVTSIRRTKFVHNIYIKYIEIVYQLEYIISEHWCVVSICRGTDHDALTSGEPLIKLCLCILVCAISQKFHIKINVFCRIFIAQWYIRLKLWNWQIVLIKDGCSHSWYGYLDIWQMQTILKWVNEFHVEGYI